MSYRPAVRFASVLPCFFVLVITICPHRARAQRADSVTIDSLHRIEFAASSANSAPARPRRTIDMALTGGLGYYAQGATAALQPVANADFFARSNDLDFTAGFHWGFSDPATKGLSVGLRFPISESENLTSGVFADAGLLISDNGQDTETFSTGIRAAVAARSAPLEYRFAVELRRFPTSGAPLEAWAGLELGFFFNLLREGVTGLTPKDSLRTELRYIATSAELESLESTTSQSEIEEWLNRFWAARNITGSPMNEARQEYMRRVGIANKKYGTPQRMGVTTDLGRVLLLYGEPDQVETAPSTVGSDRQYVLWIDENRVKGYRTALFLFVSSHRAFNITQNPIQSGQIESGNFENTAGGTFESHGEFREIYSNIAGEPSEGIPSDLPPAMASYIEGFR